MSDYEKIVYVSGSSTLTTHPRYFIVCIVRTICTRLLTNIVFRPIDQTSLKNADVLILTGLTQTPAANPDAMLGDLCMTAGMPEITLEIFTVEFLIIAFFL